MELDNDGNGWTCMILSRDNACAVVIDRLSISLIPRSLGDSVKEMMGSFSLINLVIRPL
jgi:hypothetical protein